jgi:hypothetical protein
MIWSDLAQLIGAILLMIGAVLPVVNPLGDALIFLRMTPGCDAPNHGASRETHRFLFVHFIAGPFDPHWASRGVAVVCVLGWKHLAAETPKPADVTPVLILAKAIVLGRAFAPLTMPRTIDAGVVSAAFTVGAKHARTLKLVVGVSRRSSCCASVGESLGTASRRCWLSPNGSKPTTLRWVIHIIFAGAGKALPQQILRWSVRCAFTARLPGRIAAKDWSWARERTSRHRCR